MHMDGSSAPSPAPAIDHDRYDDTYLRQILRGVKSIAMVGASANWNRPSYFAMKYLLDHGFKVYPVNPGAVGQTILGQTVYANLDALPETVDMVDIFRSSAAAGPITDDAIRHGAKVVWMQLTIRNDEAARRAEAAGLKVVMNRCPKIEHSRLLGTLEWHGIASGVISSKKRRL
jgi:predicted CoA-binding protein